jgi:alanine racemase
MWSVEHTGSGLTLACGYLESEQGEISQFLCLILAPLCLRVRKAKSKDGMQPTVMVASDYTHGSSQLSSDLAAPILGGMDERSNLTTWVDIDLDAIENNARYFVDHTGVQLMAVVKANGYGHGAQQTAQAATKGGATWCAVARAEEALWLREAGVDCPILILGLVPKGRMIAVVGQGLSLTVWDEGQIQAAAEAATEAGKSARLHLKVDTGMSRLGAQPEQAVGLARTIAQLEGLVYEGLLTHFACADEADPAPTDAQASLFRQTVEVLDAEGLRPPLVHAANSAASLTRPDVAYDIVRLGIAMYGLMPSPDCPLPPRVQPALAWKARLAQVKVLPPGRGVSYGHEYVTKGEERLGTVSIGYADGFRRTAGNQVLVGGRKVPVVGRVCMDQIVVQLDGVPEARAGDEVILIGEQGGEQITAEEVAANWGTINYEVTCGINARVPRLYA